MSNYFIRKSAGDWWIQGHNTEVKCTFSGSLEVAYQMGLTENIHQQLAGLHLDEATKKLFESTIINDSLEGRHDELPLHAATTAFMETPFKDIKDVM